MDASDATELATCTVASFAVTPIGDACDSYQVKKGPTYAVSLSVTSVLSRT